MISRGCLAALVATLVMVGCGGDEAAGPPELEPETERIVQQWTGEQWVNDRRMTQTLDEADRVTEQVWQTWTGRVWNADARLVMTYEDSLKVQQEAFGWADSAWVPAGRSLFTYDDEGRLTEQLGQQWADSAYVDWRRDVYTYDRRGRDAAFEQSYWDGEQWRPQDRRTTTYDGDLAQEDRWAAFVEDDWQEGGRTLYTYDAEGRVTERRNQRLLDGSWLDHSRVRPAYEGNRLTEDLFERWQPSDSTWQPVARTAYRYD